MGIPTYGAILIRNKNLQKTIDKLQIKADALVKESEAQRKLLSQYNDLLESLTLAMKKKNHAAYYCDQGHFKCKIDHARYGLVRKVEYPVRHKVSKPGSQLIENECLNIKIMSKKVDLLQAKYGLPSSYRHEVFVASSEYIRVEHGPLSSKTKIRKNFQRRKRRFMLVPFPRPLMFNPTLPSDNVQKNAALRHSLTRNNSSSVSNCSQERKDSESFYDDTETDLEDSCGSSDRNGNVADLANAYCSNSNKALQLEPMLTLDQNHFDQRMMDVNDVNENVIMEVGYDRDIVEDLDNEGYIEFVNNGDTYFLDGNISCNYGAIGISENNGYYEADDEGAGFPACDSPDGYDCEVEWEEGEE